MNSYHPRNARERERVCLLLISEVSRGLDDVATGRIEPARPALLKIKRRLAARARNSG